MELRTKAALFFFWVIIYQMTDSDCMPRRYRNNCSNKSLNIFHKPAKANNQSNTRRAPAGKIYYKASPVNESVRRVPDLIPDFENNFDLPNFCNKSPPPVKSFCFEVPEVPDFEKNLDLSRICIKAPPALERSWDIPEVPNFENNFDLSKVCFNLPSVKKGGTSTISKSFNPFCSSFGLGKSLFPEVQYPLDVNDFRLPTYWDEYIEQKLKQQEKEIDEVCKDFCVGNPKARDKPKVEAIKKAVDALIKSKSMKKGSQTEFLSTTTPRKTQCSGINTQSEIEPSNSGSVIPVVKPTKPTENVIPSSIYDTCDTASPTPINIEPPQGNQIPIQDVIVSQPVQNIEPSSSDKEAPTISDQVITTEEILAENALPVSVNEPVSITDKILPENFEPEPIDKVSSVLKETIPKTDGLTPEKKETSPHVDVPPSSAVWELPIEGTGSTILLAEILSDTPLPTNNLPTIPADLPKDSSAPLPCDSLPDALLPTSLPVATADPCDSLPTNDLPIGPADLPSDTAATTGLPTKVHLLKDPTLNTPLSANEIPIAPTDLTTNILDAPANLPTDTLAPLPSESLDTVLPNDDLPIEPKDILAGTETLMVPIEILLDTPLPTSSSLAPETLVSNTPLKDDVVFNEDDGLVTLSPFLEETPRIVRSCREFSSDFLCPEDMDYFIVGQLH